MTNTSYSRRRLVVAAGILVQVCLGVIFAWSAFASPLTREPFGFSRFQTQMIFSSGLAMFALAMAFGSARLRNRVGSRLAMLIGGLVLAGGYLVAGFAGNHFLGLTLGVGILAGTGIGLAYVHPIAILVKWFPDKKGSITGIAVAGFGFGALLWIMLTGGFKFGDWLNLMPGWNGLYGNGWSVNAVFRLYGLIFALLIPIGAAFMTEPPADWSSATAQSRAAKINLHPHELIRTRQYWILFTGYAAGTMSGLMVIGIIKLFAADMLTAQNIDPAKAASIANTAMGFFYAIMNALGRIIWGVVSDKLGRKCSIILMSASQSLMMLLLYRLGQYEWGLYLAATMIGFNFGGNFALFPAAAADYFGSDNVGANYPRVFLGYGLGGILGPLLGGLMGDYKLWLWAFIPASAACLIAAVLTCRLKPLHPAAVS